MRPTEIQAMSGRLRVREQCAVGADEAARLETEGLRKWMSYTLAPVLGEMAARPHVCPAGAVRNETIYAQQ